MKFLRNLLATILGSMIGVFLLFFLFMMIFAAIGSMSDQEVTVKNNSVLTIDFSKQIKDQGEDNLFGNLDLGMFGQAGAIGLQDMISSIDKAKDDKRIRGIVLDVPQVMANFGGMGFLKEIRNKLEDFKTSGKFVYAYNKYGYSQGGYWLATVADSVFMHPQGGMMLNGFGGEMMFYPDMLKKLGIEPEIIRHGKFKAAVEPYMLKKMSPENKEQTMKYITSLWDDCLADISQARKLSVEELNKISDAIAVRNAETALAHKLVDAIYHPDEFNALLKEKLEIEDEEDDVETISLAKYQDVKVKSTEKAEKDSDIAVIYAEGAIMDAGHGNITPKLAEVIEDIRKDEDIKAVVLRVNSPGGSALVSEFILREMKLLKKEKPVVVSFGNVAASGGYYISCAADTIVAEPTTITGSIGVFGMFMTGKELLEDKVGLSFDGYGTNEHSAFGGGGVALPLVGAISNRRLTDFERNLVQQSVEETYDTFITHVAEGRNMTKEQVDAIGQGRVWVARDAKEIGLVDVFGGLEDAIQIAKGMVNIEGKAKVHFYPKKKEPFEEFIEQMTGEAKIAILKSELGANYNYYKQVKEAMTYEGIQALMPYELQVQ